MDNWTILDYDPRELGDRPPLCEKLGDAHDSWEEAYSEVIQSQDFSNTEDVDKAQKVIIDLINQGDSEFTSEQLAAQFAYGVVINMAITAEGVPDRLEEQLDWLAKEGAEFDHSTALRHSILIFCHYL